MRQQDNLKKLQEYSKRRHGLLPRTRVPEVLPVAPVPEKTAAPKVEVPKKDPPYVFYVHPEIKIKA